MQTRAQTRKRSRKRTTYRSKVMDIRKILAFSLHFLALVLFMLSSTMDLPLEFALMAEGAAIFTKID